MSTMPIAGGYADYDLENQQLERRRRMAEMLAQQGMGDAPQGRMVGNQFVAPSWTQQLAHALNGPMAAYEMRGIDQQQKELGQRKESEMQAERQKFADLLRGTPASAQVSDDQLAYGGSPADSVTTQMPAIPGNPNAAWNFANSARDPALRQAALAQLLKEDEAFTLKPGEQRFKGGRVIAGSPEKPEFGTTPQYEKDASSPTGFVSVLYGKNGERKVIGPANPMNQYTTGTVDANNNLAMRLYEFNNLGAKDRADLENKAAQLGISAQQLFFETGMGYRPQGAMPAPNAPPPNFTPSAAPQGPLTVPPRQQGPLGVRPAAARPPVSNDRAAIFKDEYTAASNKLAEAISRNDQPNIARLSADVAALEREMKSIGMPVAAPQGPASASPADGLTPAARVAVAKDQAVKTADAVRALPQVEQTAKNLSGQIDALIGDLGRPLKPGQVPAKPHPGFESAVGATYLPGARFVPGSDTADFANRLEQIQGGTFLKAFESLKGGGQITEIEGQKATQALNRMRLAQSEKEFVAAAREFQQNLELGVKLAAQQAGKSMPAPQTPTQSTAPLPAGYRPL